MSKIEELFKFDEELAQDADFVIGTDEAGRGPGAGPVFAAAVCFCKEPDEELFEKLQLLNDSKQLSERKREQLFYSITELEKSGMCKYFVQSGSVEQIDKINILNTSLDCMRQSCNAVLSSFSKKSVKILVDGNRLIKNLPVPQTTVVKGDSKSAAIAAASILAKVTRDKFMTELSKEFPKYHWDKNKGYLSSEHIEAIRMYGPTMWHRKKFLRKILNEQESQLSLF